MFTGPEQHFRDGLSCRRRRACGRSPLPLEPLATAPRRARLRGLGSRPIIHLVRRIDIGMLKVIWSGLSIVATIAVSVQVTFPSLSAPSRTASLHADGSLRRPRDRLHLPGVEWLPRYREDRTFLSRAQPLRSFAAATPTRICFLSLTPPPLFFFFPSSLTSTFSAHTRHVHLTSCDRGSHLDSLGRARSSPSSTTTTRLCGARIYSRSTWDVPGQTPRQLSPSFAVHPHCLPT